MGLEIEKCFNLSFIIYCVFRLNCLILMNFSIFVGFKVKIIIFIVEERLNRIMYVKVFGNFYYIIEFKVN